MSIAEGKHFDNIREFSQLTKGVHEKSAAIVLLTYERLITVSRTGTRQGVWSALLFNSARDVLTSAGEMTEQ